MRGGGFAGVQDRDCWNTGRGVSFYRFNLFGDRMVEYIVNRVRLQASFVGV